MPLETDGDRLWRSLMEMAEVGATPDGGCRRLALTDEDEESLRLFEEWARADGLEVVRDHLGNMFATRAGTDPSLPAVLFGSHLDTQPSGGRFDGAYGTLAALEVVRTLNEHDVRTAAPLVVVSWTNEEGARFPQPCTGSSVFAGVLGLDEALEQRAVDGPSFGEELARLGRPGAVDAGEREYSAYFETHIEQGPILESSGNAIGMVSRGQGLRGIAVTLTGSEAHTGTTPMDRRRDALLGAARIVTRLREMVLERPEALGTVSRMSVEPGSRSVIPGRVELTIDLRHPDPPSLRRYEADVRAMVTELAADAGLDVEIDTFLEVEPVAFDPSCVEAVRSAAELMGYPAIELVSGAGHDAFSVAARMPAVMIFIPCRDGVSHHPSEYASPEAAKAGADVLMHAVLAKAGAA